MADLTVPSQAPKGAPIVMESDFSYTPPPEADPREVQEFRQAARDSIADIEAEFAASQAEERAREYGLDEPETPGDTEAPAPTETAPAPETPTAGEEDGDPKLARSIERLVQREVEVQAREARIKSIEGENASLRAQVAKFQAEAPPAEILAQFEHSPIAALKALGKNPQHIIRLAIAEDLKERGQPVPPELQTLLQNAHYESRMAALEAREMQQRQAEAARQEYNAFYLGTEAYVKQHVAASSKMPHLAKSVAADPAWVHSEIMEEIARDARTWVAGNPDRQPITFEQAALNVEARCAKMAALLGSGAGSAQVTTTTQVQKPVGTSSTPPQPKPPAQPLKPWQRKEGNIYDDGIKEALREFNRVEAASRGQPRY